MEKEVYGPATDTAIQGALNSLTAGRTWKETVKVKGSFTLAAGIAIPSYTTLDLTQARLYTTANIRMLRVVGTVGTHLTDIDVLGGYLVGNNAGAAQGGVLVDYADNIHMKGVHVTEVNKEGFFIRRTTKSLFEDCHAIDNYFFEWFITYGTKDCTFADCTAEKTTIAHDPAGDTAFFRIATSQTDGDHVERNVFDRCKAFGVAGVAFDNGFYLCGRDTLGLVRYNTFNECVARNFDDAGKAGFKINPAEHNTFNGCHAIDCETGFFFATSTLATDHENTLYNTVNGGRVVIVAAGGRGVCIKGEGDATVVDGIANRNNINDLTVLGQGGTSYGVDIETVAAGDEASYNNIRGLTAIACTYPVYIKDARCVSNTYHGVVGYGCTNDISDTGTTTRKRDTIDKVGAVAD
jgi:hypothetical protein